MQVSFTLVVFTGTWGSPDGDLFHMLTRLQRGFFHIHFCPPFPPFPGQERVNKIAHLFAFVKREGE